MAKRAIFEDVSTAKAETPAAPVRAERQPWRRGISVWLWILAALVAIMVLVGGATRLTDSGLSITEWAPVMGAVPPTSALEWEAAFEAYKTTTEFQTQNSWMTLEDFKPIYWWEWGHRQLGRAIGVVWFTGFVIFLAARKIPRGWTGRLFLVGALGGLQGAIGWWMVASGLTGRVDVAPYRLASHLGIAFLILGLLVWFALRVRLDEVSGLQARRRRETALMPWTAFLIVLVFVQVLSGALVAGLDSGQAYTGWPLMNGAILPPESFDLQPLWMNAFENPALAQFNHRILAYVIVLLVPIFVWRAARSGIVSVRKRANALLAVTLVQLTLGIVTVLTAAPLWIALVHQATALALFWVLIRARFEVAYPAEQKISA